MQQAVADRAERAGVDPPPYEFLELIGKGTYGRVYKSTSLRSPTQEVVAVKIIEVDKPDYEATFEGRDDTIQNFTKEISALQRLKDSNAKNITMIHEAFTFHSQLWLVSEYCHGGSVTTLLKACPDRRMDESFIIPLARELAVALKFIHDADIVHRDIKCANVLVMEDGTLRLADFGVAGIFETNVSKRQTIIGTPHWMPLELVQELGNESGDIQYGTEVDCWAYGCAVYEMATGHGPNNRVRPMELANALRQSAPKLEAGGPYSDRLREFVDFCLQINPQARPTAKQILEHPFLANTYKSHPTKSLQTLVKQFYAWEMSGGERKSLFYDFGAALPENLGVLDAEQEDWYFSTTLEFEKKLEDEAHEAYYESLKTEDPTTAGPAKLTPKERRMLFDKEAGADRGGKALGAIFNTEGGEYKYSDLPEPPKRVSDLPFRNLGSDKAADRTTMIDLDSVDAGFDAVPTLNDISTLRANRTNRFYTDSDEEDDEVDELNDSFASSKRESNRKTTDWKMPLMTAPADSNAGRRTVDWKFPTITTTDTDEVDDSVQQTARKLGGSDFNTDVEGTAKRDTMAFKFPMGGLGSLARSNTISSTESLPVPAAKRPPLKQTATMPVGEVDGLTMASSPDRTSMIDLDFALPEPTPQPSTAQSSFTFASPESAVTDSFSFDDTTITLTNNSSLMPGNRTSRHQQSQSEPNARTSAGSELDAQLDMNASWHHGRDPSTASEAYPDRKLADPLNDLRMRETRGMHHQRISSGTNGSLAPSVTGSMKGMLSHTEVYLPTGARDPHTNYSRPGNPLKVSGHRPRGSDRSEKRRQFYTLEQYARGLVAHTPVVKVLFGISSADQRAYQQQYKRYLDQARVVS